MSSSLPSLHDLVPTVPCRTLSSTRNPDWRPATDEGALHSEVFAMGDEAAGGALALALALDHLAATRDAGTCEDNRAVLWVQDAAAIRTTGRPYRPGLPQAVRHRLIHVAAEKIEDALFALEEGVRCRDLAAVIGEVTGNPRALDFTASRRLSLAAERHCVPLWLVRIDARRDLSSARMRWDATAAPSSPPCWNGMAPGEPAWRAELFRARRHRPAELVLRQDGRRLVQANVRRSAVVPERDTG